MASDKLKQYRLKPCPLSLNAAEEKLSFGQFPVDIKTGQNFIVTMISLRSKEGKAAKCESHHKPKAAVCAISEHLTLQQE